MRRSRSSAALALGAIMGILGGQLAESAHVDLEHAVCPEHGETVHAGGSRPRPGPAHDQVEGRADAGEHEAHCGHAVAASTARDRAVTGGPYRIASAEVRAAPRVGAAPIAVLALAPKSSPPAA